MKQAKKAFTLIELLVVIAIIALLLSIMLPSLRLAKEHAKKITCSSNLKSLALASLMYAETNDNLMPVSTAAWLTPAGQTRAGWCGWIADAGLQPLPVNEQIYGNATSPANGLVNGQLWPYIESVDAWRCPSDPQKEWLRSYGMSSQWWGLQAYYGGNDAVVYDPGTRGLVCKKNSDLRGPPALRFLFIDQLGSNWDAYFAIWYSRPMWWQVPNCRHGGGSVNGFADGHVEAYKFQPETIQMVEDTLEVELPSYRMPQIELPDSEDLQYYQRAAWGTIGW